MITHANINRVGGRLGNQFFKVAAMCHISNKYGYEIGFVGDNKPELLLNDWNINYPIL